MVIPQLILAVFSGSMTQALVPLLANLEPQELRNAGWGIAFGIGGCLIVFSLGLIVAAPIWVPWIVPGFAAGQVGLTIQLAIIQLAGMVFIALGAVLAAVSHARQRFIWAEASGLVAGVGGLAFLAWGLPHLGIAAGAWGLFLKPLIQVTLMLPVLGPACWPQWQRIPWRDAWHRMRPLLIGTAYYKTDPLVDRILTSLAAPGAMTLLNLAQQLYGAGATVLGKAVAAPMIPLQAQLAARGEWPEFRRVWQHRLVSLGLLTLGGWLLIIFAGQGLLPLLFAKRLASGEINQLWWLLILLGGMWIGGGLGTVTSGAFYACGDTQTPTRLGIITYTGYIPVKIFMFWKFGLAGLALSISGFYLINLVLQVRYLGLKQLSPVSYADG
jgi:putative peptidoglycan lipid II flippase